MGERRAYGIHTPQVPSSRPGWYGTFYWASDRWPPWQHQVERSLMCVEGRRRISLSGLTQDIKMGSCVFQCDVPHQWIAQRQVGPMSVYCDGVGCHVLCLWHGITVWQYIGQSITATSRHRREMTSDVSKRRLTQNKTNLPNHVYYSQQNTAIGIQSIPSISEANLTVLFKVLDLDVFPWLW